MSVPVLTIGETAYRIGQEIRKQNIKSASVISFVHLKDTFVPNAVVVTDEDDFRKEFAKQVEEKATGVKKRSFWDWLFRRRRSANRAVVIAGLGGKFGSRYAPMVAAMLSNCGYDEVTVVVQLPFKFEGKERRGRAEDALRKIQSQNVKVVVLDHSELSRRYSALPIGEYFNRVEKGIIKVVRSSVRRLDALPDSGDFLA